MILARGSKGDDVRTLQAALRSLGFYPPPSAIDGDFGPKTETAVRAFQKDRGLDVDGVVGAATWTAVLKPSIPPVQPTDDRLRAAGRAALAAAMRLWQQDIFDPDANDHSPRAQACRIAIDDMLRAVGWTWEIPYKGNHRGPQWCGIFAGKCYREAGIDPRWLATWFPSTARLHSFAHYEDFEGHANPKPAQGPHRLAAKIDEHTTELPFEPREGDILIVGDGRIKAGTHITLVKSFDAARRIFETVSGNGGGGGPLGNKREGVSVRDYAIGAGPGYHAMYLYRLAPSDLLSDASLYFCPCGRTSSTTPSLKKCVQCGGALSQKHPPTP